MEYQYTTQVADEPTLGNGPPQYQSRDDMNTSKQNLADEPSLANGTISEIPDSRCLEYTVHKT